MHLDKIKPWGNKKASVTSKAMPITIWKILAGLPLVVIGFIMGGVYTQSPTNMAAGIVCVSMLAGGGFLILTSYKKEQTGFVFSSKKKLTGNENAIVIFARRNETTKKDVPVKIAFIELMHPPKTARLHMVVNLKKHFYILYNNTELKHLEPFILPDKKPFSPELFKTPATMQRFKDYIDYSPPSMFQKVAPMILILAIFVVGILMLITAPPVAA